MVIIVSSIKKNINCSHQNCFCSIDMYASSFVVFCVGNCFIVLVQQICCLRLYLFFEQIFFVILYQLSSGVLICMSSFM